MNHLKTLCWSALSGALLTTLGAACVPVVTAPITTGTGGDTSSSATTTGEGASGTGTASGMGTGGGSGTGASSTTPVTLANDDAGEVIEMAVDATSVYWTTTDDLVWQVPKDGSGAPLALGTPVGHTGGLAIDATSVYFSDSGGIRRVPLGGGAETTLVNTTLSQRLAVDATQVYWADPTLGIRAVPIAGGAATTLASGLTNPVDLVVDATSVYWVDGMDGTVKKVPTTGGTVTTLASGQPMMLSLALGGGTLYLGSAEQLGALSVSGGTVTTTADPGATLTGVAVDATRVYWTSQAGPFAGGVKATPVGGGAVTTLFSETQSANIRPIALDATSVYFAMQGAIMKMSK